MKHLIFGERHEPGNRECPDRQVVEMELWDTDYLDIVERAYIRFDRQGGGEFVFGVVSGMTQEQGRGHSSLKSSGTSPNFFSTTASECFP